MTALSRIMVVMGVLAACGEDGANTGDTRDTALPDDVAGDSDAATDSSPDDSEVTSACTPLSPADLEALVFDKQDDVSTSYSLRLKVPIGVPAADYLVLQFINYNERIDAGAGTFALDEAPNDNFGTCPECIAIWVDQARPDLMPGKFLFQSSGTIRLDLDPRTRRLVGQLSAVRFREIELDEQTLSSTFVEGGDCVELTAPLDFDLRWVPPEWTCGAATYYTDDGCDCGCGAIDPDCYPGFDAPTLVESSDCSGGELCRWDECVATCAVGIGARAAVPCPEGDVCTFDWPDDVCLGAQAADSAALGQRCTSYAIHCAVTDGMPAGACAIQEGGPGMCSPLCASATDCPIGQHCFPVVGISVEEGGRGYCADGPSFTAPED